MKRDEAIKIILDSLKKDDLAFFTTGMISREAFAIGDRPDNFYMIGSMGLVAPVALGVALNQPKRKVFAIEGDGSLLLNLGAMPMVAAAKPANFFHLILDNESYESTGGQPSISSKINLAKLAKGAGYRRIKEVATSKALQKALKVLTKSRGPNFLLVKVLPFRLKDVSRVKLSPEEIKRRMRND